MTFEEEINNEDEFEEQALPERLRLTVDKGQELLRIDKFIMSRVEGATRNKIQQAIEVGHVLVNGLAVKTNYKVRPNDEIIVYDTRRPETTQIIPEKIDLNIVYEDDDVLIVNKAAGMVVHPGSGNSNGTLANALAWHFKQDDNQEAITSLARLGIVHRIDKNTSGLLLVAKNEHARQELSKQFKAHTIHRRYHALVWGDVEEDQGTITGNIGRHLRFRKKMTVFPDGENGKTAITHFSVLKRFYYVSLLEFRLETGRTHQIRVHAQHIGHPLFNDDTYGGNRIVKGTVFTKYRQFVDNCFKLIPRQALHAKELGFIHPTTGKEMFFESELPDDLNAVITKWEQYVKYNPSTLP